MHMLGSVRSIYKMDAVRLMSQFGIFWNLAGVEIKELSVCLRMGVKKVKRLLQQKRCWFFDLVDCMNKLFIQQFLHKTRHYKEKWYYFTCIFFSIFLHFFCGLLVAVSHAHDDSSVAVSNEFFFISPFPKRQFK